MSTATPKAIEILANFDRLPDAALVPEPVVNALFGQSHSTTWREVKAGRLPAPRKTTVRNTRWVVGELRKALAARAAA